MNVCKGNVLDMIHTIVYFLLLLTLGVFVITGIMLITRLFIRKRIKEKNDRYKKFLTWILIICFVLFLIFLAIFVASYYFGNNCH